jgi:predicted nucleic acid-binding protein
VALLDTTVLIDLSRRPGTPAHNRARRRVDELAAAGERLVTSRINEAEFRVGPERMPNRADEILRVEGVLAWLVILEFDASAARWYARTKAALLDRGLPVGDCDTMVAAVALANGHAIVTRNPGHFTIVPGLAVSSY